MKTIGIALLAILVVSINTKSAKPAQTSHKQEPEATDLNLEIDAPQTISDTRERTAVDWVEETSSTHISIGTDGSDFIDLNSFAKILFDHFKQVTKAESRILWGSKLSMVEYSVPQILQIDERSTNEQFKKRLVEVLVNASTENWQSIKVEEGYSDLRGFIQNKCGAGISSLFYRFPSSTLRTINDDDSKITVRRAVAVVVCNEDRIQVSAGVLSATVDRPEGDKPTEEEWTEYLEQNLYYQFAATILGLCLA